ncbi:cell division protein FtsL [Fluviibacterium sp. DFM31]|uniref:Cell division protein FtsL n=1 Tax=Meridianimarinicoccus marinus TaxID=3231483 RepID=A0ABV3L9L9_9RHOB
MRLIFGLLLGVSVLGLAFWAYQENYRTRQALADNRALSREIGQLQEHLGVLKAEWAYLNRPERLRELSELNFERLRLLPMAPEHFGRLDQVAYPPRSVPIEPEIAIATPVAAATEQRP